MSRHRRQRLRKLRDRQMRALLRASYLAGAELDATFHDKLFEPAVSDVTGSTLGASHNDSARDVADDPTHIVRTNERGAADVTGSVRREVSGGSR